MSTQKNPTVNIMTLKVMILKGFKHKKEFCEHYGIKYLSFYQFMRRPEDQPNLNNKLMRIMIENGYNPYEEIRPILTEEKKREIYQMINETYAELGGRER